MEYIDLRTGYVLIGFSDFESALSESEKLWELGLKVAYLNEVNFIREPEVREYLGSAIGAGERQYHNYLSKGTEKPLMSATESLITALQALEGQSGCKTKFMMIVDTKSQYNSRYSQLKRLVNASSQDASVDTRRAA